MFIVTARFSKKRAILLLTVLLAAAALAAALFFGPEDTPQFPPTLKTEEDRIAYLTSLGWEIDPEPLETLELLLPDPLPESYLPYNQIQLAQGYDLNDYCGRQLTRYTYKVLNYSEHPDNVQLNLYLCDHRIAAGDVIASGSHGFQAGLLFPGK